MEMENILNKQELEKVDKLNLQADEVRKTDAVLALELSKKAIDSAQSIEYTQGLAKANLNAGICCRLTSNFEAALQYYDEALRLYKEIDDRKGTSRTLNSIANVYLNLSNFPTAIEYFDECIYILEKIGDIDFLATVLSNRGLAYQSYGDFSTALKNYLQSLSIYVSEKKNIPYFLYNNIGIVYLEIENYYTALKYFNCALKIEETDGKILEESYTLANIGRTYIYMEDYSNAVTYLSEAMIIMKKYGDRQAESQVFSNLGKAYMKLRCHPEANKFLNRALKYYREIGDKSSVAHTLCELGELYFEFNDYKASRGYFNESLTMSIEMKDDINEVRTYMGLARLYIKFIDIDRAHHYLSKAIELAEKRQSYKELGRIYKLLYLGYKAVGKSTTAKKYLEKYNECFNKLMQFEEDNCLKTFTANHDFKATNNNINVPSNNLHSKTSDKKAASKKQVA